MSTSLPMPMPIQRSSAFLLFLAMILGALVPLIAPAATRAAATELFFSEYIEGSSNNKALEIYNGTGTAVNLATSGYNIQVFFNGSVSAGLTINLTGTVAAGDVYVVAQSAASAAILAQADQTDGAGWFNGDDAVVLNKGTTIVDVIGQVGLPDPGTEWGAGLTSTADNTLRRKTPIEAGDTDGTNAFDPAVEWDGFANDTFDGLGAHGSPPPPSTAVLNEFSISTTGTDVEFLEVFGSPNADLSGLSILEIEGDFSSTATGIVDEVIAVGTTNAQGFWLVNLAANTIENGTVTLLLVRDFTGALGNDLDTNEDGTFDVEPWAEVVDAVAVNDGGPTDLTYGVPSLGVEYDGLAFAPGGASRIPDGTDTETAADWVRNDFDLAGIPGFAGTPIAGEAINTPGGPNEAVDAVVPTGVTISQVYGGGGNSDATLTNDFIELFNTTSEPIDVTGWSVQYASTAGTSWQATQLTGTIAPGGYYLVQEAAGSGGTTPLPTPDAGGNIAMAAANGKVALVASATPLGGSCPVDASVDFVGYGTANCFEGTAAVPALDNTSAAHRLEGGAQDTNDNSADFVVAAPAPRNSGAVSDPVECNTATHFIHAVQGTGMSSPLAGQTVTIEGVLTGFFGGDDVEEIGYFIQEEDGQIDGDPLTSEGIMVHDPANLDAVTSLGAGAVISVRGDVHEHFGKTRLTAVDGFADCAISGSASAVDVELPATSNTSFEPVEGMLVRFQQPLTISEFFNYDRFGEVVLTVDRDFQPTAVFEPDSQAGADLAEENTLNRITLDDATSAENPETTRHPNGEPFTLTNRFRGGDTLTNVTGVMDFAFGLYRVQPTEGADYTAVNLRPEAPENVGGSLTVASFNVLNYFTTLTSEGDICGPLQDQECRGADTAEELERQQAKIVAALAAMDADVVGLIEIENHHADVPTATLVEALNDVVGAGTYDYIATGGIGTDVIRVAFIYKPVNVSPVGEFAILDSTVDERFSDEHNRPVLAQAFEETATGGVFTMAVNHLKSKGSDCGGPPDDDPVQGNCNGTRTLAAEALVDWLATDPTGSGDLDALIIGDLNSYDKEDPIAAIRDAGYTDLVHEFGGELAYSYLFDSQLGYLDTGLASTTLAPQVTGTTVWHINADEPDLLDYDVSFKSATQDAIYAPDAYRSSDHDPVIVGLDLLAYGFEGVEPPIDEANTARAGSTVPVKFELDVDFDPGVLHTLRVFDCGEWPLGESLDAVSADGTGLRYDADADQYVFAWKTSKSWAGECKALVLTLDDGSYLAVEFEFRS